MALQDIAPDHIDAFVAHALRNLAARGLIGFVLLARLATPLLGMVGAQRVKAG